MGVQVLVGPSAAESSSNEREEPYSNGGFYCKQVSRPNLVSIIRIGSYCTSSYSYCLYYCIVDRTQKGQNPCLIMCCWGRNSSSNNLVYSMQYPSWSFCLDGKWMVFVWFLLFRISCIISSELVINVCSLWFDNWNSPFTLSAIIIQFL